MSLIDQLRKVDTNADELYGRLLKTANVTIDRNTGEIVEDDAGLRLRRYGLPDLSFRLQCQAEREAKRGIEQDAIARAKIWRHIAEACKPGEQIADLTDNTQLNPWLPSTHPKFTKQPPARSCESCGLPWSACEFHYDKTLGEQCDPTKMWICSRCARQPEIRQRYKVQASIRGTCVSCGVPWEVAGVGGHLPLGSSDAWACAECFRAGKTSGQAAVRQTYPCANRCCGRGQNLTRARVAVRGRCCSKGCQDVAQATVQRARSSRKNGEKVSTVWHFSGDHPEDRATPGEGPA